MKRILITSRCLVQLLVFLYSTALFSQGMVESPLTVNPVLILQSKELSTSVRSRAVSIPDTIALGVKGIIDDFSYPGPYPTSSIWLDSLVYVNRGYGIAPISIGVATFDGLAANGYPYNFIAGNNASLPADTLTSKPIDLNYPKVDSLYLSFYYQPQGLGNDPQADDSLVLEFKAAKDSVWRHKWSKEGYALAKNDSAWNLVMIPIVDSIYLQKGFQFRFRNYATINGNFDHWHIDDVYLNKIRTYSDTVLGDISWVYDGISLLKDYKAMPWKQYTSADLRTKITNDIRNNYADKRNLNYNYKIKNETSSVVIDSFNGVSNIFPFVKNYIYTDCDVSLGCISSADINTSKFPDSFTRPTKLTINHQFSNSIFGDFSPRNDTLIVKNNFLDYFAYDDGTAESSVGLNSLNAKLALKFKLNVNDTLVRLDVYFNPLITNAELYAFYLNVWNDNGGKPGSEIYTSSDVLSPAYEKKGQNVFKTYYLDAPLLLNAGTYYVGFTQKTDKLLNVGFDKNNNAQDKIVYNIGSGWTNSPFEGSLMMRPFFGSSVSPNAIEKYNDNKTTVVNVYPNPVHDKLFLNLNIANKSNEINYKVLNLFGQVIQEGLSKEFDYIDVSLLSEGVYFIQIVEQGQVFTTKFIKLN